MTTKREFTSLFKEFLKSVEEWFDNLPEEEKTCSKEDYLESYLMAEIEIYDFIKWKELKER